MIENYYILFTILDSNFQLSIPLASIYALTTNRQIIIDHDEFCFSILNSQHSINYDFFRTKFFLNLEN